MKTDWIERLVRYGASFLLVAFHAGFAGPARAALYDSEKGLWVCTTPAPVVYLSAFFDMKGLGYSEEAKNAFAQSLAAKYGYAGPADCQMTNKSVSPEQLNVNKKAKTAEFAKSGVKVVDTGWSFEPSAARFSYVCTGTSMRDAEGQFVSVHTDRIAIGAGAFKRLRQAWAHHLWALHLEGSGRRRQCTLLPATGADAAFKALADSCQCAKQIDWNGWEDGEEYEEYDVGSPPTTGARKFECDAWAFPPGLQPVRYWAGIFESSLARSAIALKWRDRLRTDGRITGPVPTIFCTDVTHAAVSPEGFESILETSAKEAGARLVRIDWKE